MLHLAVTLGGGLGRRRIGHENLETPDLIEAGERLGEDGASLARPHFLRQIADADAAVAVHPTSVRLLHAGENATERGLAGAVGATETDPLAAADAPRHLAEELLSSVALGDGVERDHAEAAPSPWSARGDR